MVRGEQDAEAADADQDANDLGQVVAHAQEDGGDQHDEDDGPEVDELRGQDGGVAVGQHGEVVALDVEEREDEVLPPEMPQEPQVPREAILVDCESGVRQVEEDVIEEGLEGGDGNAFVCEKGRKGVCGREAEGEDLSEKAGWLANVSMDRNRLDSIVRSKELTLVRGRCRNLWSSYMQTTPYSSPPSSPLQSSLARQLQPG